jgi:hypothetical protein
VHFDYKEEPAIAVADFDGNGHPDIFTAQNEQDQHVLWNAEK